MKKWLKRFLIALVTLMILAFVGIAVFILTFDTSAYKEKLAAMIKSEYNRELVVNGEVKLSLFPRIGLTVTQASLSEPGSSKIFASIGSARLSVAIWPLVSNRFLVDHAVFTDFQANVVRREDGLFNFDDLLSDSLQQEEHKLNPSVSAEADDLRDRIQNTIFKVDVAGLEMRNGQINYSDLGHKINLHLNNVNVLTGRITMGQAFDINLNAQVTGESPIANAKLTINGLLSLTPQQRLYSAQKLQLNLDGRLGRLIYDNASLKGDLSFDSLSYALKGRALELDLRAQGIDKSSVATLFAQLSAPELDYNSSDLSLRLNDFALQAEIARKDQQSITLGLNSPSLQVSPTSAGGKPLAGKLQIKSPDQSVNLGFDLNGISGTGSALMIEQINLTGLYRPRDSSRLEVKLSSSGMVNLFDEELTMPNLRGVFFLQDGEQAPQEVVIRGQSKIDLQEDTTEFAIEASPASGSLRVVGVATNILHPHVSFEISGNSMSLDNFLKGIVPLDEPVPVASTEAAELSAKTGTQTDSTLSVATPTAGAPVSKPVLSFKQELLSRLSGVGTFNFKNFTYHSLQANNLEATLIFDHTDVQIKSLKTEVFGGKLSMNGYFSIQNGELKTDAQFSQIDLSQLQQQLGIAERLSGTADVALELNSVGYREAEIIQNLHGYLKAQVVNGAINGVNIAQLINHTVAGHPTEQTQLDGQATQTAFDQLSTMLLVDKQVLTVESLNLSTPSLHLSAVPKQGTYLMASDRLYLPALLKINQELSVQRGNVLVRVKQAEFPVLIQGGHQQLEFQLNGVPAPLSIPSHPVQP